MSPGPPHHITFNNTTCMHIQIKYTYKQINLTREYIEARYDESANFVLFNVNRSESLYQYY